MNEKMTGPRIAMRIRQINEQIEKSLTPNIFTLNNTIVELSREIDELQKQCPHEYEDGYCIFCNKMEDSNDN